jgi:hypothetical protein
VENLPDILGRYHRFILVARGPPSSCTLSYFPPREGRSVSQAGKIPLLPGFRRLYRTRHQTRTTRVAENNTAALRNAPLPRIQTELRSFLGLGNVYRRFVPRFAAIAAPPTTLLGKGTPATLPPLKTTQIEAFNNLRSRLLSPPFWHYLEARPSSTCG